MKGPIAEWQQLLLVAVGTRVTPRPPHKSRRAKLPHRAPTLSGGAIEAFFRIRVDDLRSWQPAVGVERHFAPCESPLVAASTKAAIPTLSDFPA